METFEIVRDENVQEFILTMDANICRGQIKRQDSEVTSINGTLFTKTENGSMGEVIGTFNGLCENKEMKYILSKMTHSQNTLMWSAIDIIEANVFAEIETEE